MDQVRRLVVRWREVFQPIESLIQPVTRAFRLIQFQRDTGRVDLCAYGQRPVANRLCTLCTGGERGQGILVVLL